jgi:hypothetical protein
MPRRILLIMPEFYGVERNLRAVMEESGNEVVWIENKNLPLDYHGTKSKLKLIRKLWFFLFSPRERYLREELRKIDNHFFDILFSINAHITSPYLFKYLKSKNRELISILFLWDSFSKYNWSKELAYYDKVLTFDPGDSKKYNIEYKPNFFLKHNKPYSCNENYDLFFAGKFSVQRLLLIDQILSQTKDYGINFYIKLWPAFKSLLHNPLVYLIVKKSGLRTKLSLDYIGNYEATEGMTSREFLTPDCIQYEELQAKFNCSNVVIDLPFEEQNGYTHRIIEALANGKKILTTNTHIKNELYFDPDQIHFMDPKNPHVDTEWIKMKKIFPVSSYFESLELSEWIKSIFDVKAA